MIAAVALAKIYGASLVDQALATAAELGRFADEDLGQLLQGDAEQLSGLANESFDAVVCECAYCTFPNKTAAAVEIARVLFAVEVSASAT